MRLSVIFLTFIVLVSPAATAQEIVFDPANLSEAILQTENMIRSIDNQVTMIRQGVEEAEREIRKIASLPFNIFNGIKSTIDEKINLVANLQRNIEDFVFDIGDTIINADELFTTERDYSSWFDLSIPAEERRRLVEAEIENVTNFYKILQDNVTQAYTSQEALADLQEGTGELIERILNETSDSESTVANLQSANLIAGQSYALMSQMARDINSIRIMIAQSLNRNADEFDIALPQGIDGLGCNISNFARPECPNISGDYRTVEEIKEDIFRSAIDPSDPDALGAHYDWMLEPPPDL